MCTLHDFRSSLHRVSCKDKTTTGQKLKFSHKNKIKKKSTLICLHDLYSWWSLDNVSVDLKLHYKCLAFTHQPDQTGTEIELMADILLLFYTFYMHWEAMFTRKISVIVSTLKNVYQMLRMHIFAWQDVIYVEITSTVNITNTIWISIWLNKPCTMEW